MKSPKLNIIFKSLVIGFILAAVWAIAFGLSNVFVAYSPALTEHSCSSLIFILIITIYCVAYWCFRGGPEATKKMLFSLRLDLLAAVSFGVIVHYEFFSLLENFHQEIFNRYFYITPYIFILFIIILLSPLLESLQALKVTTKRQRYFLSDREIRVIDEDNLGIAHDAKQFALAVMNSSDVFGLDGPWGVGKTSFINIAQTVWKSDRHFLVCRFEPLRFASESDLASRLISELTSTIQKNVFAPEFKHTADRYTRLIKGTAELSFFGFKLSFEPSDSSIDDVLNDIDEVLKRIDRRIIIVIDDLDRLDARTVNNVLFATKRTLNLTQATYVLCYDTETLVDTYDENQKAREYLEKFVSIKYSLLVDPPLISSFFRETWKQTLFEDKTTPSSALLELSSIFSEAATVLEGDKSAQYLPLLGNIRKAKRFVNTIRLLRIEEANLQRTDFNPRDLINLILLHLNYPGIYRRIYAEEAHGQSGHFSIKYDSKIKTYKNSVCFATILSDLEHEPSATFLLKELFSTNSFNWSENNQPDDSDLASRACFNNSRYRNLEAYLKFIVRMTTPEPQSTLILYKKALEKIKKDSSVKSMLESQDFAGGDWQLAHGRLWTEIYYQSRNLIETTFSQAIDTLIEYLPKYPAVSKNGTGLRKKSIYTLINLLNNGSNKNNDAIDEIAWRIFGEQEFKGKGLLEKIRSKNHGMLAWYDLLIFRLSLSADRQGQTYRITSALIYYQDPNLRRDGDLEQITINQMRTISQTIFRMFKSEYIDSHKNYLDDIDNVDIDEFLGSIEKNNPNAEQLKIDLADVIRAERNVAKYFVLHQLSNADGPNGSGICCGYYDEEGMEDKNGIAFAMNNYMFNICFNPDIAPSNVLHFLDRCLTNMLTSFDTGDANQLPVATESTLKKAFNAEFLKDFWGKHKAKIVEIAESAHDREVCTYNYTVKYADTIHSVFSSLDKIALSDMD